MTVTPPAPTEIRLTFSDAEEIHEGLEQAVNTLIEQATGNCTQGILVTRHEPGIYTVALDKSVPFGQTHEATAPLSSVPDTGAEYARNGKPRLFPSRLNNG